MVRLNSNIRITNLDLCLTRTGEKLPPQTFLGSPHFVLPCTSIGWDLLPGTRPAPIDYLVHSRFGPCRRSLAEDGISPKSDRRDAGDAEKRGEFTEWVRETAHGLEQQFEATSTRSRHGWSGGSARLPSEAIFCCFRLHPWLVRASFMLPLCRHQGGIGHGLMRNGTDSDVGAQSW
jgi:hypothetical protein